jgi:hypothetical protein
MEEQAEVVREEEDKSRALKVRQITTFTQPPRTKRKTTQLDRTALISKQSTSQASVEGLMQESIDSGGDGGVEAPTS